jgi:hypothetical protein
MGLAVGQKIESQLLYRPLNKGMGGEKCVLVSALVYQDFIGTYWDKKSI